jgi:hypothetical protein
LSFRSAAEESVVVFAFASASAVAFLFSCHPSPQAEDLLLPLPSPSQLLLLLLSPLPLPLPFLSVIPRRESAFRLHPATANGVPHPSPKAFCDGWESKPSLSHDAFIQLSMAKRNGRTLNGHE